jgi:hypothetical protein
VVGSGSAPIVTPVVCQVHELDQQFGPQLARGPTSVLIHMPGWETKSAGNSICSIGSRCASSAAGPCRRRRATTSRPARSSMRTRSGRLRISGLRTVQQEVEGPRTRSHHPRQTEGRRRAERAAGPGLRQIREGEALPPPLDTAPLIRTPEGL